MSMGNRNAKYVDISGHVFGNLTVIELMDKRSRFGAALWLCSCKCGNLKPVSGTNLRKGKSRSCGCLRGIPREPMIAACIVCGRDFAKLQGRMLACSSVCSAKRKQVVAAPKIREFRARHRVAYLALKSLGLEPKHGDVK